MTNQPPTWQERFKEFLYDKFDKKHWGQDGTHRWFFCRDNDSKDEVAFDCACCLDYGLYEKECGCICHERVKQFEAFIADEIERAKLEAREELIERITNDLRQFRKKHAGFSMASVWWMLEKKLLEEHND